MYKSSLFLAAFIGVVLLLSVSVNAQPQIKSWYTLPTQLSKDTPFVWVVETQALQDGTRVAWRKYQDPTAAGSFNKISPSGWACYFSADTTSTCGPTPFKPQLLGPATTFQGDILLSGINLNESLIYQLNVSSLQVSADRSINGSNVNAWVVVSGHAGAATVNYRLFNAENLILVSNGTTTFRSSQGDYFLNLNPSAGKYYLVFDALTQSTPQLKGGSLLYFEIGGVGGTQPQSGLDVSISEIDATAVSGNPVERQFTIKNPTSTSYYDLSIVLPDRVKQYLTIDLLSKNLPAGNSTDYIIRIRADSNLFIKDSFDLVETKGGAQTVLKTVPLTVKLAITGTVTQPISTANRPVLDIDPLVISDLNVLTGNATIREVIVRNIGSGNLTLQQPEVEGFSGNTVGVNWDKPIITSSIPGKITISINPTNKGDYSGKVKIKSDGGVKILYLDFAAFDDVAGDIDKLRKDVGSYKGNLTKHGVSSTDADKFLTSVVSALDTAKTSQSGGDYALANKKLEQAKSEFDVVKSILAISPTKPPQDGGGFPIWLIAVIVVVVVIVAVFVLKKIKKKPSEEEEGEYEEEGYNEEGEEYEK